VCWCGLSQGFPDIYFFACCLRPDCVLSSWSFDSVSPCSLIRFFVSGFFAPPQNQGFFGACFLVSCRSPSPSPTFDSSKVSPVPLPFVTNGCSCVCWGLQNHAPQSLNLSGVLAFFSTPFLHFYECVVVGGFPFGFFNLLFFGCFCGYFWMCTCEGFIALRG